MSVALTKVPAGTYQAYLYVWEDNFSETYNILLNGAVVRQGHVSGTAGSWNKLGPYSVNLAALGTIKFSSSGAGHANFSGVEVYSTSGAGPSPSPTPTLTPSPSPSPTVTVPAPAAAMNVLFIGNSLIGNATTSTNEDTPAVVKHLAAIRGQTLNVTEVINFGHSLQETWDAGLIGNKLSGSIKWDCIVLQEYSNLVTTDPSTFYSTMTSTYQVALSRSLKTGGKVLLFRNWALMDSSPYPDRASNVTDINSNYTSLSIRLTTPNRIAPISDGFEMVLQSRPIDTLIVADGKHPTDEAIYMNACILYGMIFGQSPAGLNALWLPLSEANFFQNSGATVLGF